MASVHSKGKASWGVSYYYKDANGKSMQKEETFSSVEAANKRKIEIEYLQSIDKFTPPMETRVSKLLDDFVEIYGLVNWSCSTYSTNIGMLRNYVYPHIGDMKMKHVNAKKMDEYFVGLRTMKAVPRSGRGEPGLVSERVIREIHVLLRTAFKMAVQWEMIGKNPIISTSKPKIRKKKVETLDPDAARALLDQSMDMRLLACLHLALGGSMRIGEITGARWSNVHFGEVENSFKGAKIEVVDELQRITNESLDRLLDRKTDIRFIFPNYKKKAKSKLVLKALKTDSSIRTIWLPATAAKVLWLIKQEQDKLKEKLGDAYHDYDMVIAHRFGRPIEESRIKELYDEVIERAGLKKVTFHSLRHTSTTVKLLISGGDIKTVQGDTGHAQAKMVTDTYAEIIDSRREKTAVLFEEQFYAEGDLTNEQKGEPDVVDNLVQMLTANPDMAKKLMEALGKVKVS